MTLIIFNLKILTNKPIQIIHILTIKIQHYPYLIIIITTKKSLITN